MVGRFSHLAAPLCSIEGYRYGPDPAQNGPVCMEVVRREKMEPVVRLTNSQFPSCGQDGSALNWGDGVACCPVKALTCTHWRQTSPSARMISMPQPPVDPRDMRNSPKVRRGIVEPLGSKCVPIQIHIWRRWAAIPPGDWTVDWISKPSGVPVALGFGRPVHSALKFPCIWKLRV